MGYSGRMLSKSGAIRRIRSRPMSKARPLSPLPNDASMVYQIMIWLLTFILLKITTNLFLNFTLENWWSVHFRIDFNTTVFFLLLVFRKIPIRILNSWTLLSHLGPNSGHKIKGFVGSWDLLGNLKNEAAQKMFNNRSGVEIDSYVTVWKMNDAYLQELPALMKKLSTKFKINSPKNVYLVEYFAIINPWVSIIESVSIIFYSIFLCVI